MALLRASGEHTGDAYDFQSVNGEAVDRSGVPHADLLIDYAEAVTGDDPDRLIRARTAIAETLGPAALVDSAGVAAIFQAVVRIADATGIPLEEYKAEITEDVREELGINDFPSVRA